jgi:uncharacterized protein
VLLIERGHPRGEPQEQIPMRIHATRPAAADRPPRQLNARALRDTRDVAQVRPEAAPGSRSTRGGGRTAWRILLPFAGAYAVNIAVASAGEGRMPLPLLALAMNVAAALAALAFVLVSGRFLGDPRSLRGYGLWLDRRWFTDLGAGLGIGMLGVAIPFLVGLAAGWFEVAAVFDPGVLALWPGGALIVAAMLCVGLWEELIFRGVFVRNIADALRSRVSPARAIAAGVVLSAVVFTVGHLGQPEHPTFLVTWLLAGLLFGALYVFGGTLALPIGVHASYNIAIQAVFVRTDIAGAEGFSAITRISVDNQLPPVFEFGGVVEAASFICAGILAAGWLTRRGSRSHRLVQPAATD